MDLSVVIVNWNTRDLLSQCVESVYDTAGNLTLEVLVVDNGSTDGSSEMVRKRFPRAWLIRNQENRGFARANNQAITASRGRHVLLLNSDTVVLPDALCKMVRFMDCHPDAGAAGPKLINPDGSFQASYADFPNLLTESLQAFGLARWLYGPHHPSPPPRLGEREGTVDWVAGACLLVRREVIDTVGLLDEGYWMYSEETDWCYRIHQADWKVYYLPEIEIIHIGGGSSRKRRPEMIAQLYRSKLRFFSMHRGAFATTAFRAVLVCTSLAKVALALTLGWLPARKDVACADLRAARFTLQVALQQNHRSRERYG